MGAKAHNATAAAIQAYAAAARQGHWHNATIYAETAARLEGSRQISRDAETAATYYHEQTPEAEQAAAEAAWWRRTATIRYAAAEREPVTGAGPDRALQLEEAARENNARAEELEQQAAGYTYTAAQAEADRRLIAYYDAHRKLASAREELRKAERAEAAAQRKSQTGNTPTATANRRKAERAVEAAEQKLATAEQALATPITPEPEQTQTQSEAQQEQIAAATAAPAPEQPADDNDEPEQPEFYGSQTPIEAAAASAYDAAIDAGYTNRTAYQTALQAAVEAGAGIYQALNAASRAELAHPSYYTAEATEARAAEQAEEEQIERERSERDTLEARIQPEPYYPDDDDATTPEQEAADEARQAASREHDAAYAAAKQAEIDAREQAEAAKQAAATAYDEAEQARAAAIAEREQAETACYYRPTEENTRRRNAARAAYDAAKAAAEAAADRLAAHYEEEQTAAATAILNDDDPAPHGRHYYRNPAQEEQTPMSLDRQVLILEAALSAYTIARANGHDDDDAATAAAYRAAYGLGAGHSAALNAAETAASQEEHTRMSLEHQVQILQIALTAYTIARDNDHTHEAAYDAAHRAAYGAGASDASAYSYADVAASQYRDTHDDAPAYDEHPDRYHEIASGTYDNARMRGAEHPSAKAETEHALTQAGVERDEARSLAETAALLWAEFNLSEPDWQTYENDQETAPEEEQEVPEQVQAAYDAARAAGQSPENARRAAYHYARLHGADDELASQASEAAWYAADGRADADNETAIRQAAEHAIATYRDARANPRKYYTDGIATPERARETARQQIHDQL
jgi:hypothetical protein